MSANDATGYNLRGIEYSSKAGDTYWRKGDRDGAMPDYDRAIADYDQVIKLAPNYAVAYDNDRLGGRAYYDLIKSGIAGIGLDASKYGSHSMRLGWISTAARNGASVWKMKEISRHKSTEVLAGYVREAELFQQHASVGMYQARQVEWRPCLSWPYAELHPLAH